MEDEEKARQARLAISTFQIMSAAFLLRGYYRFSGKTGQTLENALRNLGPEIYGSMNDSRITELNGLEYVLDRLPKGIEQCNRIVMMAHEDPLRSSWAIMTIRLHCSIPLGSRSSTYSNPFNSVILGSFMDP